MASWEHFVAVRHGCPNPLWRTCQVRRKARKDSCSDTDTKSESGRERKKELLKMRARCGDVYENKGPVLKTGWESWNVIENKGTYNFKTGMLLKGKDVGCRRYVVGGEEQVPGVRCQVSGFTGQDEGHLPSADCLLPTADCLG
jgi:hypothetical protein